MMLNDPIPELNITGYDIVLLTIQHDNNNSLCCYAK